jgi:hypothetical protein
MILHICDFTSDFSIHISEEKNDITHFVSLQAIFSMHTREKGK